MENWSVSDLSPQILSNIEADCYWCLSKFLDGMQDHYTFAQPGIQRLVFRLKELVRRIDGTISLSFSLMNYPSFVLLKFFSVLFSCWSRLVV
jgi:Rab-GTPase-TBC domain